MIIVITYLLINSWDFIFKRSMRIIHLKKSVGSVPAARKTNDSFHMDTNIGNSFCGFNINWVKLLLAFGKSCNYRLCPLEHNTLMYSEASISHHHVARNKLAQDTTVFC